MLEALRLIRSRTVTVLARLGELAAVTRSADRRTQPQRGRAGHHLGKRFATCADELLIAHARLDDLIGRYPARGIKGRSVPATC